MLKNQILGDILGSPLVIRMRPVLDMDDEQLYIFCQQNEILRIERTADGDLVIQPLASALHGARNFELTGQVAEWAKRDDTGVGFAANCGFILPSGAMRSPDVAWIRRDRLRRISRMQWERFPPLCPDFVAELCDPTDSIPYMREKLKEYLDNGARLGWLIDPRRRHVYVYRPGAAVERRVNPTTVSGDPELPGFVLDAQNIFDLSF
jgi:Uma2 family endonuclease